MVADRRRVYSLCDATLVARDDELVVQEQVVEGEVSNSLGMLLLQASATAVQAVRCKAR